MLVTQPRRVRVIALTKLEEREGSLLIASWEFVYGKKIEQLSSCSEKEEELFFCARYD